MSVAGHHTLMAERVAELLGDGQWHGYEKTVRELMKLVPPGQALRANEKVRRQSKHGRGDLRLPAPEQRVKPLPVDARIASGARTIVRTFLSSPAFETDRPGRPGSRVIDWERQIRMLRPPRRAAGDPLRLMRDRMQARIDVLDGQVEALREYLIEIGHGQAAQQLAPEGE